MNRVRILAAVCLTATAGTGLAETMYVTDQLRLRMQDGTTTNAGTLQTLLSGTQLEVLERVTNYARVKTPDGTEGWVRSAYLVSDKPAALRVTELESQAAGLRSQLDSARQRLNDTEGRLGNLSTQVADAEAQAGANVEELSQLRTQNETYRRRLDSYKMSVPLSWVGWVLGLSLIGGFIGGLYWVDYRSRKRHGGIRIY